MRNLREGFLVEITHSDGREGVGESAPLPEIGTESEQQCEETLALLRRLAEEKSPDSLLQELDNHRSSAPSACCGVESALVSLLAQQTRLPLHRWMNPEAPDSIRVNQNIGTLESPVVDPEGSPLLKIKVGIRPVAEELEQLQTFASTLSQQQSIRLDANQAWSLDEATRFIAGIESLPIESLEEPLKSPTLQTIQQLQGVTATPITLDESILQIGINPILEDGNIKRVVLKPTLLGGPWTTYRIARRFLDHDIDVIITSALESSVGILSAAHCAAAVDPQQRQYHGLATSSWLADDLAVAPRIKNGILSIP